MTISSNTYLSLNSNGLTLRVNSFMKEVEQNEKKPAIAA
jgi:hypothetical protein